MTNKQKARESRAFLFGGIGRLFFLQLIFKDALYDIDELFHHVLIDGYELLFVAVFHDAQDVKIRRILFGREMQFYISSRSDGLENLVYSPFQYSRTFSPAGPFLFFARMTYTPFCAWALWDSSSS